MESKYPTMHDLRALNPSVRIRNRPHRKRVDFYSIIIPRWELLLDGNLVSGPLHGMFWATRKEAETKALELLTAQT